MNSELWIQN